MDTLQISASHRDSRLVIALAGELDVDVAASLVDLDLSNVAGPSQPWTSVSVDCSALEFVDSTGIGALVRLRNRVVAQNGLFSVDRAPSHIRHTIQATGLSEVFGIVEGDL